MRQIIFRRFSFSRLGARSRQRLAWEAGRTAFAIIGAAGYASYLSAMHVVMAALSLCMVTGTG